MSKIGTKVIPVEASVQLTITNKTVVIKGSKGELVVTIPTELELVQGDNSLTVKRLSERKHVKALHGLYRNIIANAVTGVNTFWEKRLEIVGTGYNVKLQGQDLSFRVGYSHPVLFKKTAGITFQVEGNNIVIVSGADKQQVGQVAHQIKLIKQPDIYKGKGIRYLGERIKLKPGKKAKTA